MMPHGRASVETAQEFNVDIQGHHLLAVSTGVECSVVAPGSNSRSQAYRASGLWERGRIHNSPRFAKYRLATYPFFQTSYA